MNVLTSGVVAGNSPPVLTLVPADLERWLPVSEEGINTSFEIRDADGDMIDLVYSVDNLKVYDCGGCLWSICIHGSQFEALNLARGSRFRFN